MDEEILHEIRELVHKLSKLHFAGHKREMLKKKVEGRLTELGLADLTAYREKLAEDQEEWTLLLDLLTTNETHFFRNPSQFRYLREEIIPALETARNEEVIRSWGAAVQVPPSSIMKLRILCAGCSTGEEPYSIAMSLLDTLRYPRAWDIEILAGDLSESCLEIARAGCYRNDALKSVSATYMEKYLERTAGGACFTDQVKRLVRFTSLNLKNIMEGDGFPGIEPGFAGFDIIFCRNVMIYFSAEGQQQLVETLIRWLGPGGYLFTGDAEPLHLFDHDLQVIYGADCFIYQKNGEGTR